MALLLQLFIVAHHKILWHTAFAAKVNLQLRVTGLLRKTLSSTNLIESCFSVTRIITGRVKRWKGGGGDMVYGSEVAVAAFLRTEKRFKRVKGYREIPKLVAALGQKILTGKR